MIEIKPDMVLAMVRRGIPERTARASVRAEETEATRNAMGSSESLIVLAGAPGRGKSVAACLWLMEIAKLQTQCMRWIQSGDLNRGFAYDHEAFDSLAGVFALVVDDFGVEYIDEKGRYISTLEEVLSKRFARMKKTMITTNITSPDEFALRYGERLASRIHEDGAFIVCGGEDLRRKCA